MIAGRRERPQKYGLHISTVPDACCSHRRSVSLR